LVLDKVTGRFWTLAGENLYFMDLGAQPHATNRLDLATEQITRIAELERDLPFGFGGLTASPGGELIIYPQRDEFNARIMLVENFRW
jgi:hypothetical protein